jgi:hypothetical protein
MDFQVLIFKFIFEKAFPCSLCDGMVSTGVKWILNAILVLCVNHETAAVPYKERFESVIGSGSL